MSIIYHEDFLKLTQTIGHPECPERLSSILSYLEMNRVDAEIISPEPATRDDVETVHTAEYLDFLRDFGEGHMDMDSYIWPHGRRGADRCGASLREGGTGLCTSKTAWPSCDRISRLRLLLCKQHRRRCLTPAEEG